MPDALELIKIYNRCNWKKEDFVAICLYQNIDDNIETIEFYYDLIAQSRNGYIKDDSRG